MAWEIGFDPALPLWLLLPAALLLAALSVWVSRARLLAAALRVAAGGFLVLALLDPFLLKEERAPLPDIALVAIDESESQSIGDRTDRTRRAYDAISERLEAQPNLEVRTVRIGPSNPFAEGTQGGGTRVFGSIGEALGDIPAERHAGTILLTDGQVHDADAAKTLAKTAPLHVFLTGERGERDRRLKILEAPAYALIDKPVPVRIVIEDDGAQPGEEAQISIRVDGEMLEARVIPVGEETRFQLTLRHGGANVIEIEVEPGENELSLRNNRAVIAANGVRDRLKVLLVSGEPYAGERIWRNLLKSDPAVDLVHFTILRPPNKYDGTPIRELALIDFPKHELFSRKLYDFDLIIFDRYRIRRTLTEAYFQNIARYVEDGGALLAVAGPGFASSASLYYTALARIFPSRPNGEILEQGFRPNLTPPGERHPVTADLPDGGPNPEWGRWFRVIQTETLAGNVLMEDASKTPLLVLDRIGEGRVAQLLSDHAWLWARGFEGGGPQAELLRRLAHWLMKEPDLEEEALRARNEGRRLVIERRSMDDEVPEAVVTGPDERGTSVPLSAVAPGRWQGTVETSEVGIYRIANGDLTAVAAVGPVNPAEFADMRATEEILAPAADETGGAVFWMEDFPQAGAPELRTVRPGRDTHGKSWAGLHRNAADLVTDRERVPLLPPLLALALCLGTLLAAWRVEAR